MPNSIVDAGSFYRHRESGTRCRADDVVIDATGYEGGRPLRRSVRYTQVDTEILHPPGTLFDRDEQDFLEEFELFDPKTETVPFPIMTRTIRQEDIGYLIPILQAWVRSSGNGEILHSEIASIVSAMIASARGECDRTYLVAESFTDGVVGVVGIRTPSCEMMPHVQKPEGTVELINLFVRPDQRGTGVGRRLNMALEQEAYNHGATDVVVNSGPRYLESHGFYDAMGYERVGSIADMYGAGRDAQVWRKTIVDDEIRV